MRNPTPDPAITRDTSGRFRPGCSGNPEGKAPGTLNWATRLRGRLEGADPETIADQVVERAMQGSGVDGRFLIDRLAPKPRPRPGTVALPRADGTLEQRYQALFAAVARGEVAPGEAAELAKVLDGERRVVSDTARVLGTVAEVETGKAVADVRRRLAAAEAARAAAAADAAAARREATAARADCAALHKRVAALTAQRDAATAAPKPRGRAVAIPNATGSQTARCDAVFDAMARGALTPAEAVEAMRVIETRRKLTAQALDAAQIVAKTQEKAAERARGQAAREPTAAEREAAERAAAAAYQAQQAELARSRAAYAAAYDAAKAAGTLHGGSGKAAAAAAASTGESLHFALHRQSPADATTTPSPLAGTVGEGAPPQLADAQRYVRQDHAAPPDPPPRR